MDYLDADAETELAAAHVATELYERGGKNFCRSRVNSGSKSASESDGERETKWMATFSSTLIYDRDSKGSGEMKVDFGHQDASRMSIKQGPDLRYLR